MSMNSILEFMDISVTFLLHEWQGHLMKNEIPVLKDLIILKYIGYDLFVYLFSYSMPHPLLEEY